MDKLKKFNNVRYHPLIEAVDNLQESDFERIFENFDVGKYQRAFKKLMGEIELNLYNVGTFGVAITAMYPIIAKLMETGKFSVPPTTENVVLLTICAITVLIKENKEKAQKLLTFAAKKGVSENDLDQVINQIKTTKGIFAEIAQNFGKVISTFTDMLAYTSLLVPFSMVLGSLI